MKCTRESVARMSSIYNEKRQKECQLREAMNKGIVGSKDNREKNIQYSSDPTEDAQIAGSSAECWSTRISLENECET